MATETAIFNYINHDYVPRVDLQTLDKTFNRLETGHNEAVKAARDLNVAISSLDMDNSEEPFKQQLYNEVTQLIDNQTIYGNISNAYDDLIYKTGQLLTDPRIVGRIKSNKEKKDFDARVDQTKISDGMKQWFKDMNPYQYIDGENGQMGEIWKPTRMPVDDVDMVDFMNKARQFVADERGNYQQTAFLDANGNPTSDYSKSFDGSIYYEKDGQWQKLSADKINRAIQLAIEATPGAAEAFKQNYDYQLNLYNRSQQFSETPIIQGLTDSSGNIYSYDKWLDGKFNEYSNLTAYNYTTTKTTYGPAKANYLKYISSDDDDFGVGSGRGTGGGTSNKKKKVADNTFNAGTLSVRGNTYQSLSNIMAQCTNIVNASRNDKDKIDNIYLYGQQKLYMSADNFIKSENITDETEKDAVRKAYEIGRDLYSGADRDNAILLQEYLNDSFSDSTEKGANIVKTLNNLKTKYGVTWFNFDIGNKLYEKHFVKDNKELLRQLNDLGIQVEQIEDAYRIHISEENFNILPKLRAAVANLHQYKGGNIISGALRNLVGYQGEHAYRITASNKDTNDGPDLWGVINVLKDLGDRYKEVETQISSYIPSTLKEEGNYLYNVTAYNSSTAGSLLTRNSDAAKQFDDNIRNSLRNLNENSFTVYKTNKDSGDVFSPSYNIERQNAVTALKGALATNSNNVQINLIEPYNDGNIGFKVSFPSGSGKNTEKTEGKKDNAKTTKEKTGTVNTQSEYIIFIPETEINDNGYYNALKNQTIYSNKVDYAKNTNGSITNLGYNKYFGDTRIISNNGSLSFNSNSINDSQAVNLQVVFDILAAEKRKDASNIDYNKVSQCVDILSEVAPNDRDWSNVVINYLSNN